MASLRLNKILPVAIILIIVAIATAALITLARVIFFSGSSTSTISADISKEALLSNDVDHSVTLSVRGPIVADESFRSYQIKITSTSRELNTYSGYSGKIINKLTLSNNVSGYEQFTSALYKANLLKGTELTGDSNDLRGICATGKVYQFTVMAGNQVKKQLWTSTCSGSKGSLAASVSQLINLFTAQIPNSTDIINKDFSI